MRFMSRGIRQMTAVDSRLDQDPPRRNAFWVFEIEEKEGGCGVWWDEYKMAWSPRVYGIKGMFETFVQERKTSKIIFCRRYLLNSEVVLAVFSIADIIVMKFVASECSACPSFFRSPENMEKKMLRIPKKRKNTGRPPMCTHVHFNIADGFFAKTELCWEHVRKPSPFFFSGKKVRVFWG